jgi:hypothetical protein
VRALNKDSKIIATMSDVGDIAEHPLTPAVNKGAEALQKLSTVVNEGRKRPAGVYAFFSHNSHAMTALQDCNRILRRLFSGRALLTQLSFEEQKVIPRDWPGGTPYPEEISKVINRSQDATEFMKLDFESLYVFGGVLLDQWAFQAIAIGNIECPKRYPFRELVDILDENQNTVLAPLWTAIKNDALWLYYQLRFYRNRFIVHADRPWQRGTTRSIYGNDFNLFIPTPPGWLDDEALDAEIKSLMHLAPERIRNARDDYWEKARPGRLIEVLFDMVPLFEKPDREHISRLFGQKGGSTPDFATVAGRLLRMISEGTEQLTSIAEANLTTIDLGRPHSTSDEMWSRRKQEE